MTGHKTFEPGNLVPQDWASLSAAAAASRVGYRVARRPTPEGAAVVPAAEFGLGAPGN